jgi:hypothetical protein
MFLFDKIFACLTYFFIIIIFYSLIGMVVRDKSGEYDPFDSINELMDNLELDARRTNQLINQPWKAY